MTLNGPVRKIPPPQKAAFSSRMHVGAVTKMVKNFTVLCDCLICAFVFDDALLSRSQITSTGGPKTLLID